MTANGEPVRATGAAQGGERAGPVGSAGRREVPARHVRIDHQGALPKHFVGGDLVMSHVVAVLSATFPNGEDFFVRSVRAYRDRIDDPELRMQVRGFSAQESLHGREHRAFNARLAELGYPTPVIDRLVEGALRGADRVLPASYRLAITAALEHYTATLAEVMLRDQDAREMLSADEVLHLLAWHAVEEYEHKAVAFDVFQTVSANHRVRTGVMNAVTAGFVGGVVLFTALSLVTDRAARSPRRLARSVAQLRRSPFLAAPVRRKIRDYNRRDFHPDDHHDPELLAHWRIELFASTGMLAGQLERSA